MNMHEPNQFQQQPASHPPEPGRQLVFSPGLAINLMMTGVMIASIAYALARFLTVLVALPVAVALGAVFGHFAHMALDARVPTRHRLIAATAALLIFLVTCGLSYGSLYAALFAEQSSLRYFEESRRPLMQKINGQLANAETARRALQAWADHSEVKSQAEAKTGGSCPSKAESTGIRGPIAKWRESEKGIAGDLAKEFSDRLKEAGKRIDPVRDKLPTTYAESLVVGAALNAGAESVESLTRGAFPASVADTLKRQAVAKITWRNGETFACGDTARDELLARAAAAVAELQRGTVLEPLRPPIDLRQDKEVMITGLLRGFNLAAAVATGGLSGSFKDDPLMTQALNKGWINRETLPFALAALIELCVVLTASWARDRGSAPIPFEPVGWLTGMRQRQAATARPIARSLLALWSAVARVVINLFYAVPIAAHGAGQEVGPAADPRLTERELRWAETLLLWLAYVHDCAYLCVPIVPSTDKARTAARCLEYQGKAVLLASAATWEHVSRSPEFAHRVLMLLPDAKLKRYEIYRLSPDAAQAFRLQWLEPGPERPRSPASPQESA